MVAASLYYLDLCIDIRFRALTDTQRSSLTGPLFRGALGNRLRMLTCTTGLPDCVTCPLNANCLFPAFFAPGDAPRPFFLRTPVVTADDTGWFRLTLVGSAISQLPILVAAIRDMGWGCTDANIKFDVTGLRAWTNAGWVPIGGGYSGIDPVCRFADVARGLEEQPVRRAAVVIVTPLQLASEGRWVSRVEAQAFLLRLVERVDALSTLYCGASLPRQPWAKEAVLGATVIKDNTRLLKAGAESHRQRKNVDVSGLMGEFELAGDLTPFAPYLWCLPALGVGKKTTRGCGECEVTLHG